MRTTYKKQVTSKMARPRTKIQYSQLDKLLGLQCTLKECAFYFNCSEDTIERAVRRDKNTSFAEYRELKRQAGLISLRRSQFQLSEKNPSMAIWLGKQYLNQNDTPSTDEQTLAKLDELLDEIKTDARGANNAVHD